MYPSLNFNSTSMEYRLFKKSKSGLYFFQFKDDEDQKILTSSGYESKETRDDDLIQAIASSKSRANYEIASDQKGSYVVLKDNAGKTLARSEFGVNTESIITTSIRSIPLLEVEKKNDRSENVEGKSYTSTGNKDDYKPLPFYKTYGNNVVNGYDTFSAEGEHFFSYSLDNTIHLISEGYSSTNGRDNGVNSVTKSMPIRERYVKFIHENGKHFFNLKAGNNQNIATSRWYNNEGELDQAIDWLTSAGKGTGTGRSTTTGTVPAELIPVDRAGNISIEAAPPVVDTGEVKPKKKRKKRTTEKKPKVEKVYLVNGNYPINDVTYQIFRSGNNMHYFTFKNKEDKTILLNSDVRGFETEADAQAALNEVLIHAPIEKNFVGKTTKNGKYYFYLQNEDEKNIAKSFFFSTSEIMQETVGLLLGDKIAAGPTPEEIAAQQKAEADAKAAEAAALLAAKKADEEKARLKAEADAKRKADEEQARLKAEADAKRKADEEQARLKAEADAKRKADEEEKVAAAALASKAANVDEYLECSKYEGHKRSNEYKEFSTFSHGGEYYFALLDGRDNVVLRSEGYTSEKGRDNGIQSVIKNKDIEERWSVAEEGSKYYSVLKAGNHQEIGRSCPKSEKGAVGWKAIGAVPLAAAGLAASVGSKPAVTPTKPVKTVVEPVKAKTEKVVVNTGKKTNSNKKVAAAAKGTGKAKVAAASTTKAAAVTGGGNSGCMKYLLWLLPFLLLLLLLWFVFKGCESTPAKVVAPVKTEVVAPPVKTAAELKAEAEAVKAEEARVAAAQAEAEAKRIADEKARIKAETEAKRKAAKTKKKVTTPVEYIGNKSTGF